MAEGNIAHRCYLWAAEKNGTLPDHASKQESTEVCEYHEGPYGWKCPQKAVDDSDQREGRARAVQSKGERKQDELDHAQLLLCM